MATRPGPEAPAHDPQQQPHDPYAKRPGYVTGADGRTDTWSTAAAAGIVTGIAVLFVSGLLLVPVPIGYPGAVVIGTIVAFAVRARRRVADRREGRSPDAVSRSRSQATIDANGGRRFFVAQNPVVVIVMGGIFLAVAVAWLVGDGFSVGSIVVAVLVAASAVCFVVQGIGTLVVRRRERARGADAEAH
ncbi:hypothetical protein DEJ23_13705 [Curtobacterium sp. MCSS17_008]|uniref:hypothetical protein n=1 Tax=Curtobacterium sp. MCSS17_008 TaxID=2175647 RepID=UPI000DA772CF|nr:hypothetical protein [Curtobacterium sp. MCSS17_008]PZF54078.1 hypothetical protein DEJ23_13705 [Curtobacterium sp. MCSS17_008]